MPRRALRSRFLVWATRGLLLLVVLAGWKAAWRFGPALAAPAGAPAPALFPLHARLLLQAGLAYPRPLEATVPFPAQGSNASIQLKLMGLLDGAGWTMKALAAGRVEGRDLRVRAGALHLRALGSIGPAQEGAGPATCRVDYRVRWELPEGDRDLWGVKHLVDLCPPRGLEASAPGQELRRQATLLRRPWGWTCAPDPGAPRSGSGPGDWRRTRPAWIF